VRTRALIAFDASGVSGALLGWTFGGMRVKGFSRAALSPGALVPSALEPNVASLPEVRDAAARVAADLGIGRAPVTVVAPQGVARLLLLNLPAGVDPLQFARYRFADLPYPAAEAVIDVLPVRGGRAVAAAMRRLVVEDYEAVVAAAGLAQERLDITSLAALAGLLKDSAGDDLTLDLILGDVAFAMAAHRAGVLSVLRHRRRDRRDGEAERLHAEAERTAALAGIPMGRLRVVGSGARALLREWSAAGLPATAGWETEGVGLPHDAAELPWLGALLA
jgi:hypothetical protein